MDDREKLADELHDLELVDYFYLNLTTPQLLSHLKQIDLKLTPKSDEAPFNAIVKGYQAATDQQGHPWIVKPVTCADEALYHRVCMLVYLLDHQTGTLSAPLVLTKINGKPFRATKVIRKGIQISSYNYLNKPYIDYIRQDLVNRWIYFDEDRNPNNYLVIQNSQRKDFLVAIDFDKADLTTTKMKITGDPDKFGWFRTEKTRFLTLLRPEHFQNQPLELFDTRLEAFNRLSGEQLKDWAWSLLEGWAEPELAETLARNLRERIQYVNEYFRTWFKPAAETPSTTHDDDYSAFGKSFLQMYGDKR